jgi:hypothetical protein
MGLREGLASMPPPPAGAIGQQQALLVSMKPDPMAATRIAPGAPASPAALEVPDLDLGLPPPRAAPAANQARSAPARITLMRGDGPAPSGLPPSAMGGGVFDDDDMVGAPERMASAPNLSPMSGPLDGVGLAPGAAPVRTAATRHAAAVPVRGASTAALKARLRGPVQMVGLGLLVMIGDFAYSQTTGELFSVGPVRPLWVAGPLVVVGILMALLRIMQGDR